MVVSECVRLISATSAEFSAMLATTRLGLTWCMILVFCGLGQVSGLESRVLSKMMRDSSGCSRKHVQLTCAQCDSEFWRVAKMVKDDRPAYCSLKCHGQSRRIAPDVRPCGHCGKPVTRMPSQKRKSSSGERFCDRKCAAAKHNQTFPRRSEHPNWKGGRDSYRIHVLRTRDHSCENPACPVTAAGIEIPTILLDVDHISGDRSDNSDDNLMLLCVWCHCHKTRIGELPG